MKRTVLSCACLAVAGCAAATPTRTASVDFALPYSVVVRDAEGGRVDADDLLRRLAEADIVLLGELHDNATHHAVRGQLIAASASRRAAIVFEQFEETREPIELPVEGAPGEAWLDRSGFDRESWKWPLHRPVVEAAIAHGASVWGSGVSREALRSVVREGESAAPSHLRPLLEAAPLDDEARAILDRELDVGHCGQLPANMFPGMRAAQTVRDAAMTRALLDAHAATGGPAWLIAGNGHVRRDIAVPRMLRAVAPDLDVIAVGLLERPATGAEPTAADVAKYDLVVVTPSATREDPCAAFRMR